MPVVLIVIINSGKKAINGCYHMFSTLMTIKVCSRFLYDGVVNNLPITLDEEEKDIDNGSRIVLMK